MNEENINKLFEELATKANSEDAVNKAEVEVLRTELADIRDQLARKSQTKSHTADTSAQDEERLAQLAFVNSNMLRTANNGFQLNGIVLETMSEASFPFFQITDQYNLPGKRTVGHHEGFTSAREWMASNGVEAYSKAMPITTAGTPTAQAISNSRWLAEPTINYVTASSTGSQAAWISQAPVVCSNQAQTGGFLVTMRVSIKDFAAGKRWFVGLVGNPVVPGNVNTSTLTNFIGVGADAGDSNIYTMSRGASGTASRTQQNIAATLNGETVTFVFSSFPGMGETKMGFQFGGYGWGGSFNFNGLLYPAAWVSTGTTSTPVTLSLNRVYVEYLTNN